MKLRFFTIAALALLMATPSFAQDQRLGTVPAARIVSPNAANANGVVYLNHLKNDSWRSLSDDEKALRMNRDYDYPYYPSSASTVVVPLTTKDIAKLRRAEAAQRARADANFKAMSADERRRFIEANYGAFRAGLKPRPLYIRR